MASASETDQLEMPDQVKRLKSLLGDIERLSSSILELKQTSLRAGETVGDRKRQIRTLVQDLYTTTTELKDFIESR